MATIEELEAELSAVKERLKIAMEEIALLKCHKENLETGIEMK